MYNDGYIKFYNSKPKQTDFNAKKNTRSIEDLDFLVGAYYSEESKRQQDFLFAESLGKKLTLKVKIPLTEFVQENCKAVINNYLYDVIHIDSNQKKRTLYIYLEGIRGL